MKNRERIKSGFREYREKKLLFLIPAIYLITIAVLTKTGKKWLLTLPKPFSLRLFGYVFVVLMIEVAVIGSLGLISLAAYPIKARKYETKLAAISFVDKLGGAPVLLTNRKEQNGILLEFFSDGIPLEEYEQHSKEIETALNLRIISVQAGRDKQHVIIKAVKSKHERKKIIMWNNVFVSNKDFVLVLGENDFGIESVDISVTPHILIGGGTGSGKTKLLKLILMECVLKGASVYIADFKGGVDYPKIWHEKCSIITNAKDYLVQLDKILSVMEERRSMLIVSETPNIAEHRKKTGESVSRIIVAVDEVAEVLDKTGLGKDDKALVSQIEAKISTIARQGRAFGIHLVLATQRPDADVLKGQIKNNIPYKVCGRADKVLSQIILDTTDAAEKIMPNDQGMFLTNSGVLFQAYYAEDDAFQNVGK